MSSDTSDTPVYDQTRSDFPSDSHEYESASEPDETSDEQVVIIGSGDDESDETSDEPAAEPDESGDDEQDDDPADEQAAPHVD